MKKCTFFGHRDCPDAVKSILSTEIENLIVNHDVKVFYVGSQGRFDALVRSVLREMQNRYVQIRWYVVLAYVPARKDEGTYETLLPEGIENVPKRFAISYRNRWMAAESDYIISYVTHSFGGAAKIVEMSRKIGKTEINLAAFCGDNSG